MNNLLLYSGLIFLFEPNIFVKIPILNMLYIGGIVLVFGLTLYKYIKSGEKISKLFLVLLIYRLSVFIPTLIYDGDILKVGYLSMVILTADLVIEYYLKRDPVKLIKALVNIFTVMLLVNICLYIVYPRGLYHGKVLHFLGIRTRFSDYAIPLMALIFIEKYMCKVKMSRFIIVLTVIALNILLPFIATAVVGVIIFLIGLILFKDRIKINNKFLVTAFIIINILVVGFRVHTIFRGVIEDALGKSMSLSGRTDIWDKSFEIIQDKFLFGYGYNNDGCFVIINNLARQAHNQLLQCLYDGGIVSTIIFIYLLYYVAKKLDQYKGNKIYTAITSILLTYYIIMLSEIYAYYPQFFVMLILGYNIPKLIKVQEDGEKDEENLL